MELGTIQKEWIKSLREHPERQTSCGILGQKDVGGDGYKACCLGELRMVDCRLNNLPLPFDEYGKLRDEDGEFVNRSDIYLSGTYKKYGLRNERGVIKDALINGVDSLAGANDSRLSWSEIADFIEANPEKVFTHAV